MHQALTDFCKALDKLATDVTNGWGGDQTFCEAWGWQCATVTRHDMAAVARRLAADIRTANPQELSEPVLASVQDYPRRLAHMTNNTLPNFWGTNGGAAVSAYLATLDSMRATLQPYLGWQLVSDPKAVPSQYARRLRSIRAELEDIEPDLRGLAETIQEIKDAHAVAESLPVDLQALRDARDRVMRLAAESESAAAQTQGSRSDAAETQAAIKTLHDAAEKLVANCENAYRITTTKGLAAAFDQRAGRLAWSIAFWVIGLVVALALGAWLGAARIEILSKAISVQEPRWPTVWMHLVLSVVGIGAPLWFAWLATRQIGQRFRLAEDYAFKASVAKAYEGYRKEAARLDPVFEARLFASALTRLDEAPLRLIEDVSPGSPWHEFFSSSQFQEALETVPELRDRFIEFAKSGAAVIRSPRSAQGFGKSAGDSVEKSEASA